MLRLGVSAWLAHVRGEEDRALEQMQAAAELEFATPKHAVTPAPTLPADEMLGDLLMECGQPEQALAAYQRSLELHSNRLNGLIGAARAAQALGHEERAMTFYAASVDIAARDSARASIKDASARLQADGR